VEERHVDAVFAGHAHEFFHVLPVTDPGQDLHSPNPEEGLRVFVFDLHKDNRARRICVI